MEGLYVDIRSLLDETTQERYHERIGGEYMGKSGVINQDFKGEDNTEIKETVDEENIIKTLLEEDQGSGKY